MTKSKRPDGASRATLTASCPFSATCVVQPSFFSKRQRMAEAVGVSSTTSTCGVSRALSPRAAMGLRSGPSASSIEKSLRGRCGARIDGDALAVLGGCLDALDCGLRLGDEVFRAGFIGEIHCWDRKIEARVTRLGVGAQLATQRTNKTIREAKADSHAFVSGSACEREPVLELLALLLNTSPRGLCLAAEGRGAYVLANVVCRACAEAKSEQVALIRAKANAIGDGPIVGRRRRCVAEQLIQRALQHALVNLAPRWPGAAFKGDHNAWSNKRKDQGGSEAPHVGQRDGDCDGLEEGALLEAHGIACIVDHTDHFGEAHHRSAHQSCGLINLGSKVATQASTHVIGLGDG
eukprot:scaffold315054_cov24-Tisochrysis_lutea.AAC.2